MNSDRPLGTFRERLTWLLAGRSITPWLKRIGVTGGSITRLGRDEGRPSAEGLSRIMRTENVSISWLLEGQGAPFLVTRTGSEEETAQVLDDELADPGWEVALLHGDGLTALLLFQPAEMQIKGEAFRYVAIQLIAGPLGDGARALLEGRGLATSARLPSGTMRELYAGQLGTWRLLGGDNSPGLVDLSRPPDPLGTAEAPASYDPVPPVARLWPHMTDAERQALQLLLGPFLSGVEARRATPAPPRT